MVQNSGNFQFLASFAETLGHSLVSPRTIFGPVLVFSGIGPDSFGTVSDGFGPVRTTCTNVFDNASDKLRINNAYLGQTS